MVNGLLISLALAGALVCPLMMLLGRRGIGPGCTLGDRAEDANSSAESLRRRQKELAARIAVFEAQGKQPEPSAR